MPGPCSICGHRHTEECEEYMAGLGRTCRCPEYVDPELVSEVVVVVTPEQRRVAEGVAVAGLVGTGGDSSRCGCGHEAGEHFATPRSTACTVCKCRRWTAERTNEEALAAHFAKRAVSHGGEVG